MGPCGLHIWVYNLHSVLWQSQAFMLNQSNKLRALTSIDHRKKGNTAQGEGFSSKVMVVCK